MDTADGHVGRKWWHVGPRHKSGDRDDGKRYVVRADEKLSAFLELESAIRGDSGY